MKYSIHFIIVGKQTGLVSDWVPNSKNPVEAESLCDVLSQLGMGLPTNDMVDVVGVRIERVPD